MSGFLFSQLEPEMMKCINIAIKGRFPGRCQSTIKRMMKFFLKKTFSGRILMATREQKIRKLLKGQYAHQLYQNIVFKGVPRELQWRCAEDARTGTYEKICWPHYLMYCEYMIT